LAHNVNLIVTKVEFEEDVATRMTSESSPASPSFPKTRQALFLSDLAIRPNDAPHDPSDLGFRNYTQSSTPNHLPVLMTTPTPLNPEADSFAYMETLIESLAVLGKLGNSLDTVAQRLPTEIFTLVETTLDEVEERAEYGRRGSIFFPNRAIGRSENAYTLTGDPSTVSVPVAQGVYAKASCLRLVALESSAKRVDHEILKDLFWTLYSKLDAVAQGLRVVYEVANRVGSVRISLFPSDTKNYVGFLSGETSKIHLEPNLDHCSRWLKYGTQFRRRLVVSVSSLPCSQHSAGPDPDTRLYY
jgi:exocyst complex component 4